MEVTINGSAKEIAALVLEIQERQFKGPDDVAKEIVYRLESTVKSNEARFY